MSERGDNPNINDPAASLPVKRKRGRPRKYDVPANEPRARRRQPPGSSQGPLVIDHRPGSNLSVVLSRRSQAVGSSGSKASLGSTPLIRPQHNAASQTVPPQIRDGRQEVHTAVSTDQAIPMQSRMVSDSGIQSPANLPHVPHTLVGQTVYGYLEATFSYGYVISVKIEETGEILKGVLYDPLLSNPIHVQDDIAAAAPEVDSNPVADDVPNAIEAEVQTKPLQPVLMTKDTDDQNENSSQDELQQHDLCKSESESSSGLAAKQTCQLQSDTEKLYKALGLDGVHEIFEESDIVEEPANDQVMHEVVETSATVIELAIDSNLVADDVPNAIEAEVQTKPLQPVLMTEDTDDQNENLSQDEPQQHDLWKSESESSSGLVAKQTRQLQSDTEKLYKALGLDGVHEIFEESDIAEELANDQVMHEVVETSATVIELAVDSNLVADDVPNAIEAEVQTKPLQPVLMTEDTDDQNENSSQDEPQQHDLWKSESESSSGLAAKQTRQLQSDTEKLYKALGLDGVHEIFEESDIAEESANDQVMHEVVETSATVIELAIDSNLVADDVPNAIEAEVQTKPLQPVLMTEDTDDQNENSSQDEPQQHDLWKSESESSSGLVAKQTRQLQSDTEKLYKALGLDGVHEIFEESDIVEELANDQVMHEVVETLATVIELAVDSNLVADDVPNAIEAEVQTKPLQPVLVTMDTDYQNENSSQDASQRHDLRKSESECSSGLAAKQTSQLEKLYKSLGLDGVHESSEESYDEPEVVESSAAVIELAVGNEHQNSLQSSPQQPVD